MYLRVYAYLHMDTISAGARVGRWTALFSVFICKCMNTYMYTHICKYVYTYKYIYICVFVYMHMDTISAGACVGRLWTALFMVYIYICIHVYIYTHICKYVYIYKYIYIYLCVYVYMRMHTISAGV